MHTLQDQDALLFELIREFLVHKSSCACHISTYVVTEIFMALQCNCCQGGLCSTVYFRNQISCDRPHANNVTLNLSLLFIIWATQPVNQVVGALAPHKIVESLEAYLHLGHVCPIQAIKAVRSYHSLLL